jgi:hypothetical protein
LMPEQEFPIKIPTLMAGTTLSGEILQGAKRSQGSTVAVMPPPLGFD